jgi:hypothetical protein
VTSGNVNTKLRNAQTGVLVNELALFDDMNMTTGANLGTVTASQIRLPFDANVFNPLASAAGYFGTVPTTSSGVNHGWGTPVSGTVVYAENTTTASRKHVFYYNSGSFMVNNFQAPGHRVGNWFTEQAAVFLTTQGHALLEVSILAAAVPAAF